MAAEIHFNSAINANGKHVGSGCETLYYPGSAKGKIIAEEIQKAMRWSLGNKDRGIKEGWYRQDHPGRVDYHGDVEGDETILYFLEKTRCPAVIIEPEFIHHQTFIREMRVQGSESIGDALLDAAAKLDLL